jgi:protein SCO1/2
VERRRRAHRAALTEWAGTLAAGLACVLIAGWATWTVTCGLRAWTSEEVRRLRVEEAPWPLSPMPARSIGAGAASSPWPVNDGHATLVTFMYARCATVCGVLGSEFEQLQTLIRVEPTFKRVRLLSISFDPSHDSPAALRQYGERFHAEPALWGIVAPDDRQALERVLQETGVVVIDDRMGGYAHNAAIHVVDASGRLIRIFDYAQYRDALEFAQGLSP